MNITPDNYKPGSYPLKTLEEELFHLQASITPKGLKTIWKPIIDDMNKAIEKLKLTIAPQCDCMNYDEKWVSWTCPEHGEMGK